MAANKTMRSCCWQLARLPGGPNFPGADLPNVTMVRTLGDCRRILANVTSGGSTPAIAEVSSQWRAAASLRGRGPSVDVVAPESHPFEKVFGRQLSDLIVDTHARKGVRLHLGAKVKKIEGRLVILVAGDPIEADFGILGLGVEPRVQLAQAAGLTLDRGVLVDARLRTSDQDIFAAGDIARWPDPHSGESIRVEHWVVAERQGQVAAAKMLGRDKVFAMAPFVWTKHFDLSIRYVGHAETWDETVVEGNLANRDGLVRFRKVSLKVEMSMETATV